MEISEKNYQDNNEILSSENNGRVYKDKIKLFLNSYVILSILVISQFKPQSIIGLADYHPGNLFNGINQLWIIAQIISFLILSAIYMRKFKIHSFNILFYITMFYIAMTSYLNGAPLSGIASVIIPPISVLMMIELAYQNNAFHKIMRVIYAYFGSLIILNYITMFVFPDSFYTDYRGMDITWIFGNYQQNLNWFIVFIAVSYYVKKSWRENAKNINNINIFTYMVIILTTLKVWSATTLVSLGVIFGLLLLTYLYPKISSYLNVFYAYLVGIITTLSIVIFEIQKHFIFLIEGVLQKSVDFTGRMKFWENTINYIDKKPAFGHGIELSAVTFEKIGKTTAHNHYLNLLYNGGIIYILLTCALVYIVVSKTKKYNHEWSIIYINISLIGYFVYFLAEAKINLNIFVLLLITSYYITNLLEEQKNEQFARSRI